MENMAKEGVEEVSKRKERAVLSQSPANTYDCNKSRIVCFLCQWRMR